MSLLSNQVLFVPETNEDLITVFLQHKTDTETVKFRHKEMSSFDTSAVFIMYANNYSDDKVVPIIDHHSFNQL